MSHRQRHGRPSLALRTIHGLIGATSSRVGWIAIFAVLGASSARAETSQMAASGNVDSVRAGRSKADLAITHVAVVDVADGTVRRDMTVLVKGNRIIAVDRSIRVRIPRGALIVPGREKYLIPGLWDMHVHTTWEGDASWALPLFVSQGVTGVRDTGGDIDSLVIWRERTASGALLGPRIVGSGPVLDGHPAVYPVVSVVVTSEREARRAVDSLADRGVDFIKSYEMLTREAFFAVADQARRRGLPLAGHVPLTVDAREASDAGLRSLEHLRNVDLACSSVADSVRQQHAAAIAGGADRPGRELRASIHSGRAARLLETYDAARCAVLLAHFATNQTWVVPTLAVATVYLSGDTLPAAGPDELRMVPLSRRQLWEAISRRMRAQTVDRAALLRRSLVALRRLVLAAQRAGVGTMAGTDVAPTNTWLVPGFSLHHELELLVQAGLTPLEALRTATINPATYLNATDSLGTIAPGKIADLVLLDANPLDDIRRTRQIAAVVANGRLVDAQARDSMLRRLAGDRVGNQRDTASLPWMRVVGARPRGR